MVMLQEKKKTGSKQKTKNKTASGTGGAVVPKMNAEKVATEQELSEDEGDEVSSTHSLEPPAGSKV